MHVLRLNGFGPFEVNLNEVAIATFPTDKVRALLVYLALESHAHRREVLAALLWPEMPQATAMTNLRLALHRLRQTFDRAVPEAGGVFIQSNRQTIQLNSNALITDVTAFRSLLATCAGHPHSDLIGCEVCLAHLEQAVSLYRGELLTGFGVEDAPAFEEWLLLCRESFHQQAIAALHVLVQAYEQRGNDVQAHLYASRLLTLDPIREETHRQLMRTLARRGLRTEALAQYESCCQLLRAGLGVEPDIETVALAEQIRAQGAPAELATQKPESGLVDAAQAGMAYRPRASDWQDVPRTARLYGRQTELAQLRRWLIHERCVLVGLFGMGGVGKTTLAAALANDVGAHFDRVIWRSLLNAPPPDDVLREMLQILSGQHLTALPPSLDEQLALLLSYLRQQRCLLILDNLESILYPDQPGRVRPGYEGYIQLMQQMTERSHQSCLLLTSRERPQGIEQQEEDTPLVRTLALEGLDVTAGHALLAARGLTGQATATAMLVERYSGNPLALKLVAQTVHELFGGDIDGFLAVETLIFDDIRAVLDQQFARLSPLEQEILVWLAIEREPITAQPLRANLVNPGSPRAFIEALRMLQRRSLLSQSGQGFVLQNVVIEYLTEHLVERVAEDIATSMKSGVRHVSHSTLNRFALLKATAKEYIRLSQVRLIVQPILKHLLTVLGYDALVSRLQQVVAGLRSEVVVPGYAAGNVLNLLLQLDVDLHNHDFSGLYIWQAYLQGKVLQEVNFSRANLAQSVFTYVFGDILAVHFDAAGQLHIAGLLQGKLCVWRAMDGQMLREYQSFGAGASIARFSLDGALLASADTDHNVRVWDIERGQLLQTLSGHPETPWMVRFGPRGDVIASSGGDGVIHLWEVATSRRQNTFHGPPSAAQSLAFTSDGQLLASGHVDGTICLWRTKQCDSEPVRILRGHTDVVHGLIFADGDTVLASGSYDRTIRLWGVHTGEQLHTLNAHTLQIRWLALSPDGYTLASAGHDHFVCLWDVRSGQRLHTLLGHAYAIYHLAFRADGRILASVGVDQTIYLWDVASGQRLDTLQVYRNELHALHFCRASAPGVSLLASVGDDCMIRLWEVAAGRDSNHGGAGQLVRTLAEHTQSVYAVTCNPTGTILVSGGRGQEICMWEISSGRRLHTLYGHTGDIKALDFSPDGARFASASRDKTVRVWDAYSGQLFSILQDHTDQVLTCAFSPDGRFLASGGYDRTVRIWEMPGGQLFHTLAGHAYGITSVAFSPDSQVLASSSYDRTMRLWDIATGQVIYSWPPQNTLVLSLAFHPNGHLLATGATDYSVRLWEVPTGRLLATLRGHTNLIESVCFSPDGQWLASCGADETIKLWDVAAALAAPPGAHQEHVDDSVQTLRSDGPYAGMNITGVTGISAAQKAALKTLGAVEM